jgi:HSP20 family protein
MAIQRWDPLRDLVQLKETMNRMLDDALARSSVRGWDGVAPAAWTPPLDLIEDERRFVLLADLPGVSFEDLELKVEDGSLTLRGQRRQELSAARDAYLRVERPRGPFVLRLALPASVDPRQIVARQANGVLEIVLPKRSTASAAKIEVAAG